MNNYDFFHFAVGLGCKGPFLQERHSQPKKSTTNYLHRPMQRSLSVSSVIPASAASDSPLNHHRVIIRPDPKFTQFNPEDEDEDSENELENSQEIFHNDLNSLRPSQPQRPPHGLRSRLSLQHPPIPQSRGRLGSLSNLSAVSEAPLTAHAVSPNQQPPQPRRLYQSPYGTIREEHEVCMRTNRDHSYRVG